MKTILKALVLVSFVFLLSSCKPADYVEVDVVSPILKGEHSLRKMASADKTTDAKLSGGYFWITGSISGEMITKRTITFSWKMNSGEYAISTLPLEKIRVNPVEKEQTPTIRFSWEKPVFADYSPNKLQEMIDGLVFYAVITCNEKDWPVDVNLPLNKVEGNKQ